MHTKFPKIPNSNAHRIKEKGNFVGNRKKHSKEYLYNWKKNPHDSES